VQSHPASDLDDPAAQHLHHHDDLSFEPRGELPALFRVKDVRQIQLGGVCRWGVVGVAMLIVSCGRMAL
jgi:hypothetical protein